MFVPPWPPIIISAIDSTEPSRVGTNESDNSIALQPVFIPQTWEATKKS